MDMIEENSIPKRAKDAIKFGITLSKDVEFLLMELNEPVKL